MIMKYLISSFTKTGLILTVFCIISGMLTIGVRGVAMADTPHNDSENNSVAQVVEYHKKVEPVPLSVKYISWSSVKKLDNGLYKVVVIFKCKNRSDRNLTKKQIILMDKTGNITKVMDCR